MMAIHNPPLPRDEIVCAIMASVKYEVPTNILLAVAEKEGGTPEAYVRNTNGTYDVGVMQFNTTYLKDLARFNITAHDVAKKGCYAFDLAAWRLRGHIQKDEKDIFTRAANYHSRTPQYNAIYREDLIKKSMQWKSWLETRFQTHVIDNASPIHTVIHTTYAQVQVPPLPQPICQMPCNQKAFNALQEAFSGNLKNKGGLV